MRSKVIFFSSLIIILIALYIYSFIEDIKSYDSFSFLLAKGFLKTIPLALIIAKWLKEFKENNWVFSDPFQEYSVLPQLPLLPQLPPSFSGLSPFGGSGALPPFPQLPQLPPLPPLSPPPIAPTTPTAYTIFFRLVPLRDCRQLPSKWVSASPRFSSHTSHIAHLIINILKNILPKIIKKSLKNFGGFKICYTFALCKTKTPA